MRISLDLDGVLCDLSCATLSVAHAMFSAGTLGEDDLRSIYLRALPKAHPTSFTMWGSDAVLIITGRLPIAHGWTRTWLYANGMGEYDVICVGDAYVEEVWANGDSEGASKATAERKAEACRLYHVDLHIDNNPVVVQRMRELGIDAICVRR